MAPPPKKPKRSDGDHASPSTKRDWSQYSHLPFAQTQLAKNGRQKGRNLITWNRPRMYEKLLLHIQYECARQKVNLPWDHIAHRLNPGSSGNAISQQLARLRQTLITEGHLVPPPLPKPGVGKPDPKIRGFARKFRVGSEDFTTTEAVGWNDPFEDAKKNLPDAADYDEDDDDRMNATTSGQDLRSTTDVEDAELDSDTSISDMASDLGKGKNKMPTKRQTSEGHSVRGGIQKKLKISVRPPHVEATNNLSHLGLDGNDSAVDEDENEREDSFVKLEKGNEDEEVESAGDSTSSRSATPIIGSLSTASTGLPDPFTSAPAALQTATLSVMPLPLATASSVHHHLQTATMSPVRLHASPNRQHVEVAVSTPTRIRAIPATLMISPDGRAWTVPAIDMSDGASRQLTGTPMGPPAFATVNSSPGNFDFENATPRTAAAMQSHLEEWNAAEVPSVFNGTKQFEEQLQRSVEKKNGRV